MLRSISGWLCVLSLLASCADPFATAQEQDDIASYEKFLTDNPSSRYKIQAETRLEELYLEKARADKSLASYDEVLKKFPKGALHEKTIEERREFMFGWADETDTPESWQAFLDEYPTGNRKLKQKARTRLRMATHRDKIEIGPVDMSQINLAEDPDGPLNGWGFHADVTVNTPGDVKHLMLRLTFLDAAGSALAHDDWPVVAERLPGGMPGPAEFFKPMKPGETRTWFLDTGDTPAGWARKVKVAAVDIQFEGMEP